MPPLLERLRAALSAEYAVERELGGGGMGSVFVARDRSLDRPVAIKVLRPELASAIGVARFLREARILARLNHPHIVPVHRAGEADGLLYYVMDLVDGESLAARLERGPLAPAEVRAVGQAVLDALDLAHRHQVIHRDIKPSNVLLTHSRVLLADFGVAHTESDSDVTRPGQLIGTAAYMAPEQVARQPATPRTDLYAVGMLLYEAATSRRWPTASRPEAGDWHGVPPALGRALRRALAVAPEDRWPDAASFRAALGRGSATWRGWAVGVALAAVAVTLWRVAPPRGSHPEPPTGLPVIAIGPFTQEGGDATTSLPAAIAHAVAARLDGYEDFETDVDVGPDADPSLTPALRLAGIVRPNARGWWLTASIEGQAGMGSPSVFSGPIRPETVAQVGDSLAALVENELWNGTVFRDPSLPRNALPVTRHGRQLWLHAERHYAEGRWSVADTLYLQAELSDTTCYLCSYRIRDIDRWLGRETDSSRTARIFRHRDAFPAHYRAFIEAVALPWPDRLDSLTASAQRYHWFWLGWYLLGDELFHRGPLFGHRRREAMAPIQRALGRKPDFVPGWGHLAWVATAVGDSAVAHGALVVLDSLMAHADPFRGIDRAQQSLLRAGYAFRFGLDPTAARQLALTELLQSDVPELAAGPRLLMTFDAPRGAAVVGALFEVARRRTDLSGSGLLAQVFGFAALGRLDSAVAAADRLRRTGADPGLDFFLLEFEAGLRHATADADSSRLVDIRSRLAGTDRGGGEQGTSELDRRREWLADLIDPTRPDGGLGGSGHFDQFRAALREARAGRFEQALTLTDSLDLDPTVTSRDPMFRGLLRLERGAWLSQLGRRPEAARELLWHEHQDLLGIPTGAPLAAEVDWAFSTIARWQRAQLLDGQRAGGLDACDDYGAVARLWIDGEPPFQARAQEAQRRFEALGCRTSH